MPQTASSSTDEDDTLLTEQLTSPKRKMLSKRRRTTMNQAGSMLSKHGNMHDGTAHTPFPRVSRAWLILPRLTLKTVSTVLSYSIRLLL